VVAAKLKKKKATAEQLALATARVHSAEERLAKASARQAELEVKAPSEIALAQDTVEAAQSDLDMARAKASLVEIRSPVDGVVVTPDPAQILGKKVRHNDPILAVLADEDEGAALRP
jgi:multidrug resistance efflux pump